MDIMETAGLVRPKGNGTGDQVDAVPGEEFDEISRLLAAVCRTPVSMIMLVDEKGTWYKASGFLRMNEPGIGARFCEETLRQGETLVVGDAASDDRFRMNPQATGEPGIRFFAGVALLGSDGSPVGVLCSADMVPRVLTSEQEESMELLSRQLRARMQLREERGRREDLIRACERATAGLRASEELFRAFMNASPFLSYIKDAAGRLLFYNRSFARRFGVSEYAWLGRTDEQLWAANMTAPMRMRDLEVMAGERMVESEERVRAADGTVSSWKTFKFPCHDSAGNTLLAAVAVDVSEEVARKAELERYQLEMEEANDQLRRLAVTDELTGLRNRRAFEERLISEFSMARRRNRDLSVLLLDVDNFKGINDQWGHPAGDAVLRRLGAVLRTTVRLPDLVARYGGEEFVVLLPESNIESAKGLANRLMERVAAQLWDHEPVTISVGLAVIHDELVDGYELVGLADQALYAAKRAGKNRAVVYGGEA